LTQLPRLEAQESLREAAIVGVGTGSMKKSDHRRIMATWRRQAYPAGKKRRHTLASLAAPGLPIIEVKKSA
tara:strand:- start:10976 stop:11188 length:213 start_codon:yes stop_codon:yes gene_type:complete